MLPAKCGSNSRANHAGSLSPFPKCQQQAEKLNHLDSSTCHHQRHPQGARFAKHVDNTTGDGRRLTVLTYLNPSWQPEQGGALRLFPVAQVRGGQVSYAPHASLGRSVIHWQSSNMASGLCRVHQGVATLRMASGCRPYAAGYIDTKYRGQTCGWGTLRWPRHVMHSQGPWVDIMLLLRPTDKLEALSCVVLQGAASPVDVLPLAGRLAMFYSHQVAHEVMPAFAMRHSVTLWFYDAREHAEALASDKVSQHPYIDSAQTSQHMYVVQEHRPHYEGIFAEHAPLLRCHRNTSSLKIFSLSSSWRHMPSQRLRC